MDGKVVRFDGESWCVVFCLECSDVVQMTSNLSSEEIATVHAQIIRNRGGHIFRVCKAGVLVAALELIKTEETT